MWLINTIIQHRVHIQILLFVPYCLLEHLLFPNAGPNAELRVVVSCHISSVICKHSSHLFVFYNVDFLEEFGCLTAFSWLESHVRLDKDAKRVTLQPPWCLHQEGPGRHLAPLLGMFNLVTRLTWSLPKVIFFP